MSEVALRQRLKNALPYFVFAALKEIKGHVRQIAMWPGLEYSLKSGVHIRVTSPSDWYVYSEIFVEGEYDSVIEHVVDGNESQPFVLDLGANVGFFTLRLVDRWRTKRGGAPGYPRVACVEGSPATFRILAQNLAQPQLEGHCSVHLGLAGERSGTALISRSPNSGINSIVDRASLIRSRAQFIDLMRLVPDDRRIALLKCDIEGAEEQLLENYPELLQRVDVAVFELHHLFCNTERCRQLLAAAGLTRRTVLRPRDLHNCTIECFSRRAA